MWCLNWEYEPATGSGWSEFHRETVWGTKEKWKASVHANGWYNWREFILKLWGICMGVKIPVGNWHRPWVILNSRHNSRQILLCSSGDKSTSSSRSLYPASQAVLWCHLTCKYLDLLKVPLVLQCTQLYSRCVQWQVRYEVVWGHAPQHGCSTVYRVSPESF